MQNTEEIWRLVDGKKDDFEALSDRVWGMPELQYAEFRSVAEHIKELEREGFRVTTDIAAIPTAVTGEAGEGGPVIAFLGEYDALPGLSQEAGIAEHRPVAEETEELFPVQAEATLAGEDHPRFDLDVRQGPQPRDVPEFGVAARPDQPDPQRMSRHGVLPSRPCGASW